MFLIKRITPSADDRNRPVTPEIKLFISSSAAGSAKHDDEI
jgi:hypothetical protein